MKDNSNMVEKMRLIKKISIRALAKKTGIAHSTLLRIEKGTIKPNVYTAIKIAKALDTTVEELFIETESVNSQHVYQ